MEGREVFKHAVAMITDVIDDAFKAAGYTAADIDWFVPHQANKRIIDGSAHKLGIAPEKVVVTVDRHGNTSAASIPLALTDAVSDRRIKRGNLILLEAMGGGFTWGSALAPLVGKGSADAGRVGTCPRPGSCHISHRPIDPIGKMLISSIIQRDIFAGGRAGDDR